MNEIVTNHNDELEIDIQRLINALLNKSKLIAIVAVVCAVIAFLGTFFFITPCSAGLGVTAAWLLGKVWKS